MIRRLVSTRGFEIGVAGLLIAIGFLAGYLLIVALPEVTDTAVAPSASPTFSPEPTHPASMALSPIGVEMSPDSDCTACHLTSNGTVSTKPIPPLAHPLWGWRDCTACHANDRLVQSAPGHSSLHQEDCLVCHRVPDVTETAAPPRPHHVYPGQTCTSCHGTEAPLPTDMEGRQNCWVCHSSTENSALFETSSR
jgi:hypothetical protein